MARRDTIFEQDLQKKIQLSLRYYILFIQELISDSMQTLYTFTFSDVWAFKENSMEVLHLYTLDVCAFALVLYQIVTLFFGREKK